MTECEQSSWEFGSSGGRQVTARFDGGTISTDGDAVPEEARRPGEASELGASPITAVRPETHNAE